jgi:RNA polymerase sigma factor (sigma-70 family)
MTLEPREALRVARVVAKQYVGRAPQSVEYDDFVSAATLACMQAWQRWAQRDGGSDEAFMGYAWRCMQGACLDLLRSEARAHGIVSHSQRSGPHGGLPAWPNPLDSADRVHNEIPYGLPDTSAERGIEIRFDIAAILAHQKPEDAHVLRRFYLDGWTVAAIAAEAAVTEAAINMRLYYALRRARRGFLGRRLVKVSPPQYS